MISEKLADALNEQVNFEYYSEYVYLALASYCESQELKGFANFFKVQMEEERYHATKFYDFINQVGGRVYFKGMEEPKNDFKDILSAFNHALDHEREVTKRIYNLADIASEEREHATMSFLKWFIDEQVEEEDTFNSIIIKIKRIGDNTAALYMLDDELATRTFVPETNA